MTVKEEEDAKDVKIKQSQFIVNLFACLIDAVICVCVCVWATIRAVQDLLMSLLSGFIPCGAWKGPYGVLGIVLGSPACKTCI